MQSIEVQAIVRRSEPGRPRVTVGKFSDFVAANQVLLDREFGCRIFPGSLNLYVATPASLQLDLDRRLYAPTILIRRDMLTAMAPYLGDAQAWRAKLVGAKIPGGVDCWVFRRVGSRVPTGIIEIIACEGLSNAYELRNDDPVLLRIWFGGN